jgi:hypothetical protein
MRSLLVIALFVAAYAAVPCAAQVQVKIDHPIRHIAGLVQKPNGDPAPNIDVEVFGGRSLIANAKTDSHGKFSTDGVEPGEYEVWFTYKPHPVFKDVIYKLTINSKGSKEPIVVKLQPLQE